MHLLREQWVVTLALTPLSLLLFGQVSLVGFVANLLAIPWVTLVVTPLALAGVLWAPLWSPGCVGLQPLAAGLQWLAASGPGPWCFCPQAPLWAGVAAVLGGGLLAMRLPWALRLWSLPLAAARAVLAAAGLRRGSLSCWRRHWPGQCRAGAHGHAHLLYDAGPRFSRESDAGHRVLVPLLRALGERVDCSCSATAMRPHRGRGRRAGAATPGGVDRLDRSRACAAGLRPATPCVAGQRWVWDGVLSRCCTRTGQGARRPPPARPNTASCVLRVPARGGLHAQAVALLVGDIEPRRSKPWWPAPLRWQSRRAAGAAPRQQDLVEPRLSGCGAAAHRVGAGRLPQPLWAPGARGAAALRNAGARGGVGPLRRGDLVFRPPQVVERERDKGRRYWQHTVRHESGAKCAASILIRVCGRSPGPRRARNLLS
jgi:competence protein ComEC